MRHQYATPWIWIFLCPLAFDYKATDAGVGHAAQLVFVLPALAAGIALALIAPRFQRRSRLHSIITITLLLCVPGSLVAQMVQDNEFGNYLRVLLPFMLFQLGYIVACHPWSDYRISQFERALFFANLISLIFTFGYGLVTSGDFEEVRYRVVSVTLLGLQAVLLHEFVIAKRFSMFSVCVFAGTILIELISVTRSLLAGTVVLFVLAAWLSAPSLRHVWHALSRAALTFILLGLIAALAALTFPGVTEHWTQRLFFSETTLTGKDPTTITRLAEIQDQFDQVTSSPKTLLFGEGFGHIYHYAPDYLPDLAGQFSEKDYYAVAEWAAGHNFWVYQFFAGGLVFGVALPIAMLFALAMCTMSYRRWRASWPDAPLLPVLGRAILLFAALPATSIGGNPLGPRFSGLVFGVAFGLMIATHARLQRMAAERARHMPPPAPARMPPRGRLEGRDRVEPSLGSRDLVSGALVGYSSGNMATTRAANLTSAARSPLSSPPGVRRLDIAR